MKKSLNKTDGVTLIALVVTIAILIILSLITINIAINGGVLNKTQKAKEVYEKGQQNDINGIKDFENELDEILNDNTQEEGNGNLEIVSTFANYDDLLAVGNMLVNVNCTKDGQTVHKELINLEQTEASQSVIIENLPSGTTANVTVEYTTSSSTLITNATQTIQIEANKNNKVEIAREFKTSNIVSVTLPTEIYYNEQMRAWEPNYPIEEDCFTVSSETLTLNATYSDLAAHFITNYFDPNDSNDEKKIYIRSKAFVSNEDITLEIDDNDLAWSKANGDYWYYQNEMSNGDNTNELRYKIKLPSYMEEGGDELKLIIICEMVEAQQDEEGKYFANWD